MMIGFTMLDVNQIMFSLIIKARGRCYAFGRHCTKSTRPVAVSNINLSDTGTPWRAQTLHCKDKVKSNPATRNWISVHATTDIFLQFMLLVTCYTSGTIQIFFGVARMNWVCPLFFFSFFFILYCSLSLCFLILSGWFLLKFWWKLCLKLFVNLCRSFWLLCIGQCLVHESVPLITKTSWKSLLFDLFWFFFCRIIIAFWSVFSSEKYKVVDLFLIMCFIYIYILEVVDLYSKFPILIIIEHWRFTNHRTFKPSENHLSDWFEPCNVHHPVCVMINMPLALSLSLSYIDEEHVWTYSIDKCEKKDWR